MKCECKTRFVIQRRDGMGQSIVCKSITEAQRQANILRLTDPVGVTTRQYEIVEEKKYWSGKPWANESLVLLKE